MTSWFDHLLFAILLIVLPLEAMRWWRRFTANAERPRARTRAYGSILVQHWTLTLGLFVAWALDGRSAAALGLRWPVGWRLAASLALVAGVTLLFRLQRRQVAGDPAARDRLRGQLGEFDVMRPRGTGERRLANAVAVTAGVCEEILYRGFLIAHLGQVVPLAVAVPLACLVFGLAHAYQGATGVVKTALFGAAMSAAYLLTGSLAAPMVLHTLTDLDALWILRVLDRTKAGDRTAASTPEEGAAVEGAA